MIITCFCAVLNGLQSPFPDVIRFDSHKSLKGRQVPPPCTGGETGVKYLAHDGRAEAHESPGICVCSEPCRPAWHRGRRSALMKSALHRAGCSRSSTPRQSPDQEAEERKGDLVAGWDCTVFRVGNIEGSNEGQECAREEAPRFCSHFSCMADLGWRAGIQGGCVCYTHRRMLSHCLLPQTQGGPNKRENTKIAAGRNGSQTREGTSPIRCKTSNLLSRSAPSFPSSWSPVQYSPGIRDG